MLLLPTNGAAGSTQQNSPAEPGCARKARLSWTEQLTHRLFSCLGSVLRQRSNESATRAYHNIRYVRIARCIDIPT